VFDKIEQSNAIDYSQSIDVLGGVKQQMFMPCEVESIIGIKS